MDIGMTGWMDEWILRQLDGWMNGLTYCKNGWMDGLTVTGWMEGYIGWMDRYKW